MREGRKWTLLVWCVGLAVIISVVSPLCAMEKPKGFPDRPMTMIVPYGTGGGSDQLSRAMASSVEKIIGVPVTVVNKPGGGGVAGLTDFLAARADGYTVCEHIDDAATLYAAGKIKEHPGKDWFPVCIAQITFNQLYVRPDDDRFPNWEAFLKYAKENPGKVSVANVAHEGSMERVQMYQLQKEFGFKVNQISFDKPVERYGALVGKHVDVLFEQPGDVRAYLESKDMKPILSFLDERPDAFADTPCLKDIKAVSTEPLFRFRGFFAKGGVPEARVKYLEWAFGEAWKGDSFQKFNRSKYMHLMNSYRNRADGIKLIDNTIKAYTTVYKELGIIK